MFKKIGKNSTRGVMKRVFSMLIAVVVLCLSVIPLAAAMPRQEIVFIDSAVKDAQFLIDGVRSGVEVVLLSKDTDGIIQISESLSNRHDIDAIHIISHGAPGEVILGDEVLSEKNLEKYNTQLEIIGKSLKKGGDILLYGCNIAKGKEGDDFLHRFGIITGVDVAASIDATGAKALGGNWNLEAETGTIQAESAITENARDSYNGLLGPITFSSSTVISNNIVSVVDTNTGLTIDTYGIVSNGTEYHSATGTGTLEFHNNDGNFSGVPAIITLNDPAAVSGTYGMAIKSKNGSNFKLRTLKFNDWGSWDGNSYTIDSYENGTHKGTQTFHGNTDQSYVDVDVSSNPDFNNIDEVRIYKPDNSSSWSGSWFGINNIDIGNPEIPPTVTIGAASSITATTATLNATVNDNGLSTTVTFDYGTSTAYGTNVPADAGGTISAGTGNTVVTKTLSGIADNTTYHYRVKAVNVAGTTYGNDQTFTTSIANITPAFIGANTLTVNKNAGATDISGLLHVSDTDAGQTLTWSQNVAPSHGTLSFIGATAGSGTANVTPGGTLTYTPAAGYFGTDSFTVQVNDGIATATLTISVTVNSVPTITSQPSNQTVTSGQAASFTVAATGTATNFGYQWQKDGNDISGATSATLNIASAQTINEGSYQVVVTNSLGSTTSSAVTLTVNVIPYITTPPQSLTVTSGQAASFTVVATGTATNFGYQWKKNGSDISGATSDTLNIPSAQPTDEGNYTVVITNIAGSTTSSAVTLDVNYAPYITSQPSNLTVTSGQAASFTVVATGTATNFGYQWQKNGSDISGATSATLSIPSAQTTNEGSYRVVVTNAFGVATSSAVTLTVSVIPYIITPPQNQTVTSGTAVSFSVTALGTPTPSYQWRKNGSDISGATSATLNIPSAQPTDEGNYTVVVTNAAGSTTSSAVSLTVNYAPYITTQPSNQSVNSGQTASFTIVATGTATNFGYQWKKNGSDISGATTSTLTITNAQPADQGSYTVVVSNIIGSATSSAVTLTITVAPSINTQPQNQTVTSGEAASFTIDAAGTPLNYQWRKNGSDISGATSATLNIPSAQPTDAGSYTVVVANAAGTATSSAVTLTVNVIPYITNQPQSQTVTSGQAVSFTVAATGTATNFGYQWKKNGSNISGATSGTLSITNALVTDAGSYTVVVTNAMGSTTSSAVTLKVNSIPYITSQPSNQTVTVGQTASLTVAASGTAPLSYQWQNSGSDISGATSDTLSITNAQTTNAGSYTVVITNGLGSTTSSAATLTVNPTVSSGGSGTSSTPQPVADTGVDILVNGKTENAGTSTADTNSNGQTVNTITIDSQKLDQKLASEGNNVIVTIPANTKSDIVVGELTGQMVKNMENKEAVLEVKTETTTYTLPASQINIDGVSEQIGTQVQLKDIKVSVTIAAPTENTVQIVQGTANKNNYQIVVKPIEFSITCVSGGKTIDVSKFNGYVERTVAIPDGIDPSKITTGIVLNKDGTFSHVPTTIVVIGGKYFAKINSLTNSTYSVIYSPKTFKDVEQHWAKEAVNDMGSRLVISGIGDDLFKPDRDITRAEFAAIMVRALGLKPGMGTNPFTDVSETQWYCNYIKTAVEYKIISGYDSSKFGPMDKITREQAMAIIARAMAITKLKAEFSTGEAEKLIEGFGDGVQASDYAKNNIAACVKAGIVSGRGGNLVAPKDNISRAEVAVIVRRLLQKSNLI